MQPDALPPLALTDPLHGELIDLWNRTGRPTTLVHGSGKFYRVTMEFSVAYNSNQPRFAELPTIVSEKHDKVPKALKGETIDEPKHPEPGMNLPEPKPEASVIPESAMPHAESPEVPATHISKKKPEPKA